MSVGQDEIDILLKWFLPEIETDILNALIADWRKMGEALIGVKTSLYEAADNLPDSYKRSKTKIREVADGIECP